MDRDQVIEMMDRIGDRVVQAANPVPSREEWNALRAAIAELPDPAVNDLAINRAAFRRRRAARRRWNAASLVP